MSLKYIFLIIAVTVGCKQNQINFKNDNQNVYKKLNSPFFATVTTCSSLNIEERQFFTCNQIGAVDDLWYFGSNHTCNWLNVEQEQGTIYGVPNFNDLGTCVLHIEALSSDPIPVSSEFTITITNATPTLIVPNTSINEDANATTILTSLQVEANEEFTQIGSYSLNDSATLGAPLCANFGELNINSINGQVTFKPSLNFFGPCFFSLEFDDGQMTVNSTVVAEVEVTVNGLNDAPTITTNSIINLLQDQSLNLLPISNDVDGDPLSYSLGLSNTCSWISIDSLTGQLTGTPNDDQVGLCTLGLHAFDGAVLSDEFIASVDVVNLRPTLSISDVVISVGLGNTIIQTDLGVQSNEEGFGVYSLDNLTTPGDPCANNGVISINPTNGEISFDPNNTYNGICTVKVVFDDQNSIRNTVSDIFTIFVGGNPALSLNVSSPINGAFINRSNQSAFSVSGTCSEAGQIVSAKVETISETTNCTVSGTFLITMNLSSLADSNGYLMEITHEDSATNQKIANLFLPKDTITTDNMSFSLINPIDEEGFVSTVDFKVLGLPLDTNLIDVFSDASCTTALTNTSSLINATTEIEADINISSLSSCQTYNFYARYTDNAGNLSDCSSLSQTYYFFGNKRELLFSANTTESEQIVNVDLNTSNFNYSNIRAAAEDLRFFDGLGNKVNYYIETLNPLGDSKILLNVPVLNTNQVDMYYCQPDVNSESDPVQAFSYTSQKNLYVEMKAINQNFGVASYSDSNNILFTGGNSVLLNKNSISNLPSVTQGIVLAQGPISARSRSSSGLDSLTPYTFLGTSFGYPISNAASTWTFYNPSSVSVDVTVQGYNILGLSVSNTTQTIPASSFLDITIGTTVTNSYASSTANLLSFFATGTNEALLPAPATSELFGVVSGSAYVAAINNGTNVDAYYSDGSIQSFTINRGASVALNGGGTQGSGLAVRIEADQPIVASGLNDGDGNDAFSFWPMKFLDKTYILPTSSQYLAVACPETTIIELLDPSDSVLQTVVCTPPSPGFPGKAFLGSTTNTTSFIAGRRLVGDKKFFTYYEYTTTDETNIFGPSHARAYIDQNILVNIGTEQSL